MLQGESLYLSTGLFTSWATGLSVLPAGHTALPVGVGSPTLCRDWLTSSLSSNLFMCPTQLVRKQTPSSPWLHSLLRKQMPSFWPGFLHASTKHLTPTCPALLPPFPHSYHQHLKTLSILSLPLYISHGIGFGETKKNKNAYLKSHELVKKGRA